MNATLKRRAVAGATVVACLATLTTPASANPTHNGTVTGGTLTLAPGPFTIPWASASCPTNTAVIAHDTTVSPHTLEVTALAATTELFAGGWWVAQITRTASTAGTHGAGTINSVKVRLRVVIRGPITAGSCNTAAALRCTVNTTTDLDLSGTFTNAGGGNPSEPEVGDVASLNNVFPDATLAWVPPCFSPFQGLNGGSASVAAGTPLAMVLTN